MNRLLIIYFFMLNVVNLSITSCTWLIHWKQEQSDGGGEKLLK